MANLVYAHSGPHSPSAGGIGWVNFGNFRIAPGQTVRGISARLLDGSTVTFDLTSTAIALGGRTFVATQPPTFGGAPFGVMGYTGISDNVVLYEGATSAIGTITQLSFDHIQIRDARGNLVPNYTVIVGDGETTNTGEAIEWTTNGSVWDLLVNLPPVGGGVAETPQITGVETLTVTTTGVSLANTSAPIFTTQNATQITAKITSSNIGGGGREGIVIGFAITKLTLSKYVVERIHPNDQFELSISGTPSQTVTTSGRATGLQSSSASVFGIGGNTYTIDEVMAPGSESRLSSYTKRLTAVNLAQGGTMPPTRTLPETLSLALGDVIQYTITNTPIEADLIIVKSAEQTTVRPGADVVYSLVISNAGPDHASDVVLTDQIPATLTNVQYSIDRGKTWLSWKTPYAIGAVTSGSTVTILIKGTLPASTSLRALTNTAQVSSEVYDPNLDNNTSTATVQVIPLADMGIVKNVNINPLVEGREAVYTLIATNHGPSDARNVKVTDAVNLGNPQYSLDNGSSWESWMGGITLGTVPVGDNKTILIKGIVGRVSIGDLSNTAIVSSTTADPDLDNNKSTITTPVSALADLVIEKAVSPDTLVAGDMAMYTLTATNLGPSSAKSVQITDAVNLVDPEYSIDNGERWRNWVGTLELGTMNVGSRVKVLIKGLVKNNQIGDLSNTAVVSSVTPDPNPDNNTITIHTPVSEAADVAITKSVSPNPLVAGKEANYTLTVTNNGPSTAKNVMVKDTIPLDGAKYSIDHGATWQAWDGSLAIGSMRVGTVEHIILRGMVNVLQTDSITNTARVSSTTPDPKQDNNRATINTPVTHIPPVIDLADLVIHKSISPHPLVAGTEGIYTLTISNLGPSAAQNVKVADDIQLDNPEYSLDGGATWKNWSGSELLGVLLMGAALKLLIRGKVPSDATGIISNQATVSSTTTDPNLSNNTITINTPLDTSADLMITKSVVPDPLIAGKLATYTLTAINLGPSDAQNVRVSDVVNLLNPQFSLDDGVTWEVWKGSVVLGNEGVGTERKMLIRGKVPSNVAGNLINTATVESTTPDPNPNNNTISIKTPISEVADMAITKSVSPNPLVAGKEAFYTLVVTNHGPSTAKDVLVTDAIPLGKAQYSIDHGETWQAWTGSLDMGMMLAGTVSHIIIRGIVNESQTGSVTNTGKVSSTTPDPNLDNNTVVITTPVTSMPPVKDLADLVIHKSVVPHPLVAGTEGIYTLTISNLGPSAAQDVKVVDVVDLDSPQYSLDGGISWKDWGGSVALGTLAAGAVVKVLLKGMVPSDAIGMMSNQAVVSSVTPDPNLNNNTVTINTPVDGLADMAIGKSVNPNPLVAGGLAVYTLTATNLGPSDAQNVQVSDVINLLNPQYSLDEGLTWQIWKGSVTLGSVSVGGQKKVLIRGTVPSDVTGSMSNTGTVSSSTPDPDMHNNTITINTPISVSADMAITKRVSPRPLIAGKSATYTIVVTNLGPSDAQDVKVTDAIELESPQYSLDYGMTWSAWSGEVVIGKVEAGGDRTLLIRGIEKRLEPGIEVNTATVSSTTPDPNLNNNTVTIKTPVNTKADLAITKTIRTDPVVAGSQVVYMLTVTNLGPDDATDVEVTDVVDLKGSEYSLDNGETWYPWFGDITLGDLGVAAHRIILIKGVIRASEVGILSNTATVSGGTPDPNPDNNTATVKAVITTSADIKVSKNAYPNPVCIGEKIYYSIEIINLGPSDALDVSVVDNIPAEITHPKYSIDKGMTWEVWNSPYTIEVLESGQLLEVLIKGTVCGNWYDCLYNEVEVYAATPDPDQGNNKDCATVEVIDTRFHGLPL